MKVMILDADWRFVEQAQGHLEAHAHLVIHQNQPHEAVAKAQHWQPDLVILSADFATPDVVSALYAASPRPAVLLTDHMHRFDRAWRAWQKCGDELLMKPIFKGDELHQAVVTALENAAAGTIMRQDRVAASA